ncbi:ribosome maturation factor RimP [Nocardia implantans]|uniref:Ribosome maturation factor RimP n=1 Tax=Nocardia implantans TaxID=3108168 RepID=A0ABU6AU55_9NOCA|nr:MULTISPECIES: ribosome maturation factor RimP [unclassified Nocardia]MBF6191232.1 ribosome maturation factor RimP [Nocardia beijingensis]MEA3529231.1 ribosome maturation factor RimP [Nocardia sp. CDC192]MEB3510896.1 ribosome maturation factor RimP [Nocardia sp. CDC186]
MPMPTEERVSQLVAGLVERRGFDLEGVEIATAGKHVDAQARVQVTVDRDTSDLDALASLSTELSALLDDAGEFGETPYLLEVTTPGIDRPLTAARHWRRARGRKVRVRLREGAQPPEGVATFEARVGALTGDAVALVLGGKRDPRLVTVPLADIATAVVQVEFSPPGARELELAGGVVPGRPAPGAEDAVAVDDAAKLRGTPNALSESVTASDSPTEGIVE